MKGVKGIIEKRWKAIGVIWMKWLILRMRERYASEKNSVTAIIGRLSIIDIMVVHVKTLWLLFEQGFESIFNE